eukprot:368539_1
MSQEPKIVDVDREKCTPFLIRVFVHRGRHAEDEEYRDPTNLPQKGQIHIHTWMDATLLELKQLISKVIPELSSPSGNDAVLSFALVYPDRKGKMIVKSCGKVMNTDRDRHKKDAQKTLKDLKFEIGDFLDVSIETSKRSDHDRTHGNHHSDSYAQSNSHHHGRHSSHHSHYGSRGSHRGYYGGRGRMRGRGRGRDRGYQRGRGGFDRRRVFTHSRHFE